MKMSLLQKCIGVVVGVGSFFIGSAFLAAQTTSQEPVAASFAPALSVVLPSPFFSEAPPIPVSPDPAPLPRPPLLSEIQRARTLLVEALKADAQSKPRSTYSRDVVYEVILALYHDETSAIELLKVRKDNRRVAPLTPTPYTIVVTRDNGVNSEFAVTGAPNVHVIAIAHPIFINKGTTRHPRFEMQPVVYVPSTEYLATPEIVEAGEEYLNHIVETVYEDLRNNRIRSRAFPDRLVTDVIDATVVQSIIAIEHLNTFALTQSEVEEYLKSFYTILATNEEDAYAYARSKARAFGLVQFIPITYKNLVAIRADAKLNPDFELSMSNPASAIKAQVVFLDYNLSLLPKHIRPQYEHNPRLMGAYLAAMYNGGPARVVQTIRRWGINWAKDHKGSLVRLKRETLGYVKKYELVYEHFAQSVPQATAMVLDDKLQITTIK